MRAATRRDATRRDATASLPRVQRIHVGIASNTANSTVPRRLAGVTRLVGLAKVPKIRLHDVRHTYVTIVRNLDMNQKILSNRVGHANEIVTGQVYAHEKPRVDRELPRVLRLHYRQVE
jgi:integrase